MNPAVKCLVIPLFVWCGFSNLVAQTLDNGEFSLDLTKNSLSASELLQKESALQESLVNLDANGPWDFQLHETLSELARVQRGLGNQAEADKIYNQLLLNI